MSELRCFKIILYVKDATTVNCKQIISFICYTLSSFVFLTLIILRNHFEIIQIWLREHEKNKISLMDFFLPALMFICSDKLCKLQVVLLALYQSTTSDLKLACILCCMKLSELDGIGGKQS